jgi:hypothetical protein
MDRSNDKDEGRVFPSRSTGAKIRSSSAVNAEAERSKDLAPAWKHSPKDDVGRTGNARELRLSETMRKDLSEIYRRLDSKPSVARARHATLRKMLRWALSWMT